MNILPKKSWHVRTRSNIERVHRDQAEAERKASQEQDRVLKVEQEARLRELRQRRGIVEELPKHFNLFPEIEAGQSSSRPTEQTKTLDQKWNSLGRSSDAKTPWYLSRTSSRDRDRDRNDSARSRVPKLDSDRITSIYDPMIAMKQAEEIVRAKRQAKRRELERQSHDSSVRLAQRGSSTTSVGKPGATRGRRSPVRVVDIESSPEVLQVVEPKGKFKAFNFGTRHLSDRSTRHKQSQIDSQSHRKKRRA